MAELEEQLAATKAARDTLRERLRVAAEAAAAEVGQSAPAPPTPPLEKVLAASELQEAAAQQALGVQSVALQGPELQRVTSVLAPRILAVLNPESAARVATDAAASEPALGAAPPSKRRRGTEEPGEGERAAPDRCTAGPSDVSPGP
eukprot:6970545-Alexandrium_andersonii.AAC.1